MPKQLGALPGMYRDHLVLLREPLAGTTMQTLPGTLRHLAAWFSQDKRTSRLCELGVVRAVFRLTSEKLVV
jgi:hypothetical protein